MKTPTLAAALILAAAAAPAAAQLQMDAARDLVNSISVLKAQQAAAPKKAPSRAPAVQPPAPAEADWQKILDLLKAKGKYTPEQMPVKPGMFTLEDVAGPADGDHTEDKVTAMGALNDDEQFEVMAVVFASAEWKKNADGTWKLDQWLFETDVYGEVSTVLHIAGVLDADKKPVSGGPEKLSTSDPRIPTKYKAVIAHWTAQKP